jgi:hypothetical protein
MSNTELPISKWAGALMGVPYAGWDCLYRWRLKTKKKDEYPISNKECPMSKWAVALIGVPCAV